MSSYSTVLNYFVTIRVQISAWWIRTALISNFTIPFPQTKQRVRSYPLILPRKVRSHIQNFVNCYTLWDPTATVTFISSSRYSLARLSSGVEVDSEIVPHINYFPQVRAPFWSSIPTVVVSNFPYQFLLLLVFDSLEGSVHFKTHWMWAV